MCYKKNNNIDFSLPRLPAAAPPPPRYQWSLSNTKGPALAWLPWWPVFMRRWELIILFRCSEPWQAAVREGGRGEGGREGGGEREERKATEGPTRSSREPGQTEGISLSCCFLPVLLASWAIRSPLFPVSLLVNCSPLSLFLSFAFSPSSSPSATACSCWGWCHFLIGFCLCLACWLLPLCLNKCKHGEAHINKHMLRTWVSFMWDTQKGGGEIATPAFMQTQDDMQTAGSDLFFRVVPGIIMKRRRP